MVKISDFCLTGSGGTPLRSNSAFYEGDIPWIKSGELRENIITTASEFITQLAIEKSSAKIIPVGSILLAMYGATVGRLAILGIDAATNQAVCNIIPDKERAFTRYLYYALLTKVPDLLNNAVGGAQLNINQGIIKDTEILLPPLPEQKRIAAILDQADEIRRDRELAIAKLDQLAQSIFVEMFGDPVINDKNWQILRLGDVGKLDRGISKHRPRNAPELLGGTYPLVQTGEVANCNGYIRNHKASYSEIGLRQSRIWPTGTLCITIAANIAKTGILTFDACFPDSIVGFCAENVATIQYVRVWLSFLQKTLEDNAPESAQKNINLAILRELPIPFPPIELQEKFASRIKAVEQLKVDNNTALAKHSTLFASLQHSAFTGQL